MKDFTETGLVLVDQAKALGTIRTEEQYGVAEALGKVISKEIKETKDYFNPMKADAKKAHQNIVNAEKFSLEEYEKAKGILKVAMLKYEAEQEAIRREKEAKLRKEMEAEQAKQKELADAEGLKYEPEVTSEDIVVSPTFERKGQTRDNWKAQIISLQEFYKYVSLNKRWDLIEPNIKELNADAKRRKGPSNTPGVEYFNDPIKVF